MESKVGKLESDIDHIKSRVNEIGTDVRDLRGRMDAIHDSLLKKLDGMSRDNWATRVWALLIAAAVLGVMAHALKWL
jgi:hypothetical protein